MSRKKKKGLFILSGILIICICLNIPKVYTYAKNLLYRETEDYSFEMISTGDLIDDKEISTLEDSGITGDNLTFDEEFYPYFGLLSENQKALYKQIYANAKNIETTFVLSVAVSVAELSETIEAVYNDHPELFWLNTNYSYKYTKDGICVQITLSYNATAENLSYYQGLFESSAQEIINIANQLETDFEKEKYVHDAIIHLSEYDSNSQMNQSAYSALVNHKTVCAGYSRAFQYIMIQLGIPTYYVTGVAENKDHAWNIVKLSDGYYNVDLTWDNQNSIIYTYFNVPDAILSSTHTRTRLSISLPSCKGTLYRYLGSSPNNIDASVEEKDNTSKEELPYQISLPEEQVSEEVELEVEKEFISDSDLEITLEE